MRSYGYIRVEAHHFCTDSGMDIVKLPYAGGGGGAL